MTWVVKPGARAAIVAALTLGLAATAGAQPSQDDPRTGLPTDGVALSQGSATSGGQFTIGLGAAYLPRYEGSDEHKARALPLINYRNGRFFAGVLTGIGYNFSPISSVEFGPVLSYRPGRDEDESDRLRGLGDVDAGGEAGVYARWKLNPFFLHGSVKYGIGGGPSGTHVRLGAGYATRLGAADHLLIDAGLDWVDSEIMQGYFGVNAAQSGRSGLPTYGAGSCIRRYGVAAAWTHSFTRQWFSTIGATFYRLGNEAANSPIVQQRNVTGVSAAIGYRF